MSTKGKWWSAFTRSRRANVERHRGLLKRSLPAFFLAAAIAAWPAAAQPATAATLGFRGATGSPKAYVALYNDSAVAVVDTGPNRLLGYIPVPLGPHGLAVTPDGSKLYVSSDEVSMVSIIDTTIDRVVASIDVGPTPYGLTISPKGHELFVAVRGADQVVILDTATDRILGRVPVLEPLEIAISPDERTAYVSSGRINAPAIVIIDLTTLTVVDTVPVREEPEALSVSLDGRRLYFTTVGEDTLLVLDTVRHKTIAEIPVGASLHHHLLPAGDHSILVARQGQNDLEILDPSAYTIRGAVRVGEAPSWIAIGPDGHTAYVTNERSNDISVVDLARQTVTSTIDVGNGPREIVMQPAPSPTAVQPNQPGARNPFDLQPQPLSSRNPFDPQPQPVFIIQIPF